MQLRILEHRSGDELLARAGELLAARPVENQLQLGLAQRVRTAEAAGEAQASLLTVESDAEVLAVAIRTPPYQLTVSRTEASAVEALVAWFADRDPLLPGILAPDRTAEAFAARWMERTGARTQRVIRERLYELTAVSPVIGVPGRIRRAQPADQNVVAAWLLAFSREADIDPVDADRATTMARERVAHGLVSLWDDGGPVSMALVTPPAAGTVRVGGVYTPPAHRRRGYASACVAALSRQLLEAGAARCCLYTDLANPTSNHIYQAIGYRPVADVMMIRFEGGVATP